MGRDAGAALFMALVLALAAAAGLALVGLWRPGQGPSHSRGLRFARNIMWLFVVALCAGALLPKRTLRLIDYETTVRYGLMWLGLAGAVAAGRAWRGGAPGAWRLCLALVAVAAACGSPVGELLFGLWKIL